MRLAATLLAATVTLGGLAVPALTAQSVQGRVTEAGTDVAVFGADVEMLTEDGAVFARATDRLTRALEIGDQIGDRRAGEKLPRGLDIAR